jgi:hypothetical protein
VYCTTVSKKERDVSGGTGESGRIAEIKISDSDCKDLRILYRSDIVFAVIYGVLFVWGVVLTLLSIY